jgi:hypothetical protein
MIVPFSKGAASPKASLPKVPEEYLLFALGQAHDEGKFHVHDPRVPNPAVAPVQEGLPKDVRPPKVPPMPIAPSSPYAEK